QNLDVTAGDGVIIRDNVFLSTTSGHIVLGWLSQNCLVENNWFFSNDTYTATYGIYTWTPGHTIQNNLFVGPCYNAAGPGNNRSWILLANNRPTSGFNRAAQNIKIYHNSFSVTRATIASNPYDAANGNALAIEMRETSTPTEKLAGIDIQNNIFRSESGRSIVECSQSDFQFGDPELTLDHNTYEGSATPFEQVTTLTSFAAIQALGHETNGQEASAGYTRDVPTTPYDFMILAGAAARNSGANLFATVPTDFDGAARDTTPDAGAIEYQP
ncbi:MAG: chondroitinase-B domain-containing protein, partial [Bacteroidota bacterium]